MECNVFLGNYLINFDWIASVLAKYMMLLYHDRKILIDTHDLFELVLCALHYLS